VARAEAWWEFVAPRVVSYPREEGEAFRRRLEVALAAGRGGRVDFRIRAHSGPESSLLLGTEPSVGRRWVTRTLVPAYGASTWRTGAADLPPITPELSGRRLRAWPVPLQPFGGSPTLIDVWRQVLASLPSGIVLEVAFHPLSPPRPVWWASRAGDPGAFGVAPLETRSRPGSARPRPGGTSAAPPRVTPPPWRLEIRLGRIGMRNSVPSLIGPARALEVASRNESGNGVAFDQVGRTRWFGARSLLVAESEIAGLLPGPDSVFETPKVPVRAGRQRLALGRSVTGTVICSEFDVTSGRHLAVLGETGMGKSSLLVALARRASCDHGLILMDPLGTTAQLVEKELPSSARERLLRISPVGSPVLLNALEGVWEADGRETVRAERRLHDLVHSLRRVRSGRYADSTFWGPRLEEMLSRALRAAAAWPEGTLEDAHTLLATRARLHREIPPTALGPVQELAQRIRDRPEDAEGARRLLHELVRNRVLGRMLCAPSPEIRTAELVTPGRVVLVSGDAPEVGESTARQLLSVYLALVWSELLARPVRSKTFVVLDEAQWFAHESLAEMLRLGRFANVHVVLATQAIASLPELVGEAVWTNVADFVAFRGSPEEARELARITPAVRPETLLSMPRGHAVVLLGKGESVHWVRALHLPRASGYSAGASSPGAEEGAARPDSMEAVRASCDGPRARGPPESSDRPGGTATAPDSTSGAERVLAYLRNRSRDLPEGTSLRISLNEIRELVDPSGQGTRRAGSLLTEAGAILASERTAQGTVWTIAIDRIPGSSAIASPVEGPDVAQLPQPS
jgi:energy-coupling factor transporter ATP-binding protein EcfA2